MRLQRHILAAIACIPAMLAGCFTASASLPAGKDAFTIVIDAGHGGKDIGAAENGAKEKDINLGVALHLKNLMKIKMKDANAVMTRDNDTYLTLQQRADIANASKGDLFISIHTNSADRKNRNRNTIAGSSVYVLGLHKDGNNMEVAQRENAVIELEQNYEQKYSGFDPQKDESYIIFEMAQKKNLNNSIRFAEDVQKQLVSSGRRNRGVHQAGFWVLWATSMPSVLVELDFICNPAIAKYLSSDKGQKELAESIFKAVETYRESWNKANGLVTRESVQKSPELSMTAPLVNTGEGKVVRASARTDVRKGDTPPVVSSQNDASKRRRRSATSRAVSSDRDVETSLIPEHGQSERLGVVESVVAATTSEPAVQKQELPLDSKERKKREKAEKELKKKQAAELKAKEKEGNAREAKPNRPANAHSAKIDKFVRVYKIQILASPDLLREDNPRFCGLKPITVSKDKNLYKYTYGESRDEKEMTRELEEVRKNIPDAFVISVIKNASK